MGVAWCLLPNSCVVQQSLWNLIPVVDSGVVLQLYSWTLYSWVEFGMAVALPLDWNLQHWSMILCFMSEYSEKVKKTSSLVDVTKCDQPDGSLVPDLDSQADYPFLLLGCLRLLLEENPKNATVFRECGGARCAHNMVPYPSSRTDALKIIRELILNGGSDDLGKWIREEIKTQVAKVSDEHKWNVWEIMECPKYVLKCNKSFHLIISAWLSFLCLMVKLAVILAWFGLRVLTLTPTFLSSSINIKAPEVLSAQITTKSPKRHFKKDTQAGKWTLLLHFSTY